MQITILTIGTGGDVQPYLALGIGLKQAGYEVAIATLREFTTLVESYGITHRALRGDFLKAAQAIERTGSGPSNILKLIPQYRAMARDTLQDTWAQTRDTEVLIYSPAALGGADVAEKLGVPAFAAFPTPLYSPTKAFPSPFVPLRTLGPFNHLSHRLLMQLGPALYRNPLTTWRRDALGLPSTPRQRPVPMLYAYSEAVVPRRLATPKGVATGSSFIRTYHVI